MPDPIFTNPRLVQIYDAFDGKRDDLDLYIGIAKELKARSVLDVGCGTGTLACLLSARGFEVTAIDPAQASLAIARQKPDAEKVRWVLGEAHQLPLLHVDLAVMTGNVAQVFLTESAWLETLSAIRKALRTGGHIVFETRDPAQKAWLNWNREKSYQRVNIPHIGYVEGWCESTHIAQGIVSFRWTYVFESSGDSLTSDSTLRFREKEDVMAALAQTGFASIELRDAPDRPHQEFVFIARAA
jgi:SAM-dependent methyltransferase